MKAFTFPNIRRSQREAMRVAPVRERRCGWELSERGTGSFKMVPSIFLNSEQLSSQMALQIPFTYL